MEGAYEVGSLDWWGFVACILATCGLCVWVGVEWCRFTHKRRGLEVDRDVHVRDLLPMPPAPVKVPDPVRAPDYVPEDWTTDQEAYQ